MIQGKIKRALDQLNMDLVNTFGPEVEITLFGSVARGDFDRESDIDLLVLVPCAVSTDIEERIFDLAFDIELEHDVVFGIIV